MLTSLSAAVVAAVVVVAVAVAASEIFTIMIETLSLLTCQALPFCATGHAHVHRDQPISASMSLICLRRFDIPYS